jgi:hypothetical protein
MLSYSRSRKEFGMESKLPELQHRMKNPLTKNLFTAQVTLVAFPYNFLVSTLLRFKYRQFLKIFV